MSVDGPQGPLGGGEHAERRVCAGLCLCVAVGGDG